MIRNEICVGVGEGLEVKSQGKDFGKRQEEKSQKKEEGKEPEQ